MVQGHMEIVGQSLVPMGMWVVVGGLSLCPQIVIRTEKREKKR